MGRLKGEAKARWAENIEKQKSSGKSVQEFCKENKLSAVSFYQWRKRIEDGDKPAKKKAGHKKASSQPSSNGVHIPGVVASTPSGNGHAKGDEYTVTLASGTTVKVPSGFDGAELGRLVKCLS